MLNQQVKYGGLCDRVPKLRPVGLYRGQAAFAAARQAADRLTSTFGLLGMHAKGRVAQGAVQGADVDCRRLVAASPIAPS